MPNSPTPSAGLPKPLENIRVVEMSHMVMGPTCGLYLAQLGAEVIKVEPPGGEKTRALKGMGAAFFPTFNRGKKSVAIDTRTPEGLKALHKLLGTADVFVENFRDDTLAKMGLDHASLRARNPRLITAAHKGFLSGPYAHRPALDEVVQMATGMAYMTGPSGRPLRMGSSANDIMGGVHGVVGILAALMERQKTGKGMEVRVGLFENCLFLVAQHMVHFNLEGVAAPPMPERDFSWPVYDIFDTADDRQIFLAVVTDGHWQAACRLFGLDDLLADPGLQSQMDRINGRAGFLPRFADALKRETLADLCARFDEANIPYSPINRPQDMYDDPHVLRDGGLTPSINADGTPFRTPSLPMEFDGESLSAQSDVPAVGADTESVLNSLGYSDDEIAALSGQPGSGGSEKAA